MKVKFLSYNPVQCQTFPITDDMIEIEDSEFSLVTSGRPVKYENGHIIIDKTKEKEQSYSVLKEELRERRKQECFPIINRGSLWYETLTELQQIQLKIWYLAWLDVTDTLEAPIKPDWLK